MIVDPIVKVTGEDLLYLIRRLMWEQEQGSLHTLRVAIDDGGVKFKIGGGIWFPPLGEVEK